MTELVLNLLFLFHYRVVSILFWNSVGIFLTFFIFDSVHSSLVMNYNERSNLRKRALKEVCTFLESVDDVMYEHTDSPDISPFSNIPSCCIAPDSRPLVGNPAYIASENADSSVIAAVLLKKQ